MDCSPLIADALILAHYRRPGVAGKDPDKVVGEVGRTLPAPAGSVAPRRTGILADKDIDWQSPAGSVEQFGRASGKESSKGSGDGRALVRVTAEGGSAISIGCHGLPLPVQTIEGILNVYVVILLDDGARGSGT